MRKLLVLVALGLAGGLLAVFATAAPSATRVKVGDDYFVRPSGVPRVTVSKGARVKWVWRGKSMHNVTVAKGPVKFRSPSKTTGTYTKRMRKRGTYTIICTIHGAKTQKMKLVVT